MKSLKCLIIATSDDAPHDTRNTTGVWLEDVAAPYFVFKDSGEQITLASPRGGQIPVDSNSVSMKYITENIKRFRENDQAMYHLSHSLPLNEIKAADFDLVFLSGGYGAMYDFNKNGTLHNIIRDFYNHNKPIGLVGHATAALLGFSINSEEPFVKSMRLTAISNSEEASVALPEKPPFLLETKLRSLGALYSNGPDFKRYVIRDGSIISGQNPASSEETAKQTLTLAQAQHA